MGNKVNKRMKIVCYDKGDDSLTFIKSNNGEHTINTGITLITLSKKGQITALELMGAHKNFRIPMKVLNGIKNARVNFNFDNKNKKLFISILIKYQDKQKAPVTISEDITRFKDIIFENQNISASFSC